MTLAADVINRVLERESWARERLVAHAGRTVQIDIGPASRTLFIAADGRFSDSEVKSGSATAIPSGGSGRRLRKSPSGSDDSIASPLAASGPRMTGPTSRTALQPAGGTTPVPASNPVSPTSAEKRAGPRVRPPAVPSASSSRTTSPSKTGAGSGASRKSRSGISPIGDRSDGRTSSRRRPPVRPREFQRW